MFFSTLGSVFTGGGSFGGGSDSGLGNIFGGGNDSGLGGLGDILGGGNRRESFIGSSFLRDDGILSNSIIRQEDPDWMLSELKDALRKRNTPWGDTLASILDDVEDIQELCTKGFYEMVIKGNTDFKTTNEILDEADSLIGRATVQYQKRCESFNEYLESFNELVNALYERKIALAKLLDKRIKRMALVPKFRAMNFEPDYSYEPSTNHVICKSLGLIDNDYDGKRSSAEEYLEDAKDYEMLIMRKIAELDAHQAFLESVKLNLKEEEQLIIALEQSMARFGIATAKTMKIREEIQTLITEYILDEKGEKNTLYLTAIDNLQQLQ